MAVKTGTFNQKTSAGTQAITGLGFQPEIVLFFSSGATVDDTYQANYNGMFGVTMGTGASDSGSVASSSEDNKTTGIHNSSGRAAKKAITFCEFGEVVKSEADLDSFDSDGFTLDWTTADAVARKINYIAVSGFTSVKLVEFTTDAGAGNQSVTGVGFIPDAVINIWETNPTTASTPYITASGGIGLGAFDSSDEWGVGGWDEETNDTTTRGGQSNIAFLSMLNSAGGFRVGSFVSMDADGFTFNLPAAFGPRAMCYALCLKGGPQIALGMIDKTNSLTGSVIESIGFRPGGIILATANSGLDSSNIADVMMSVGVVDRTNQETMEFHADQATTSDCNKINIPNRGVLGNRNHDSTVEAQAHCDHFNADGFQLNWGSSSGIDFNIGYIAFQGDAAEVTGEALKVFTGVFDKKTSNGTQAITGIGFTPKVLMCWYGGATSDDTWQDFLRRGFGAATSSTNRYACGDSAEEDLTTSNCQVTKSPAHVISIVSPSGTLEGEADLTSFDSDGFTLEWTNSNATAYKIHYLALGGDDEIEGAKVVSFVTSLSTGNQSITGIGFRPDTVICFGNTRFNSQEDGVHVNGGLLLGVSDGVNNVGTQAFLLDNSATENHSRTIDIDGFIEGADSIGFEDLHSVFVSMDDDGFTFNQINASPSPGYRIFALCIQGVYTTTKNFNSEVSTTGNKAYTGVGFTPVGLLTFGSTQSVDDAAANRGIFNIGASDGTNSNAIMSGAERGVGDLACISKVGSIVVIDTTDPMATLATTEEGTLTSFDSDGFTVNWVTSDANAVRNLYMAFERNFIQSSPAELNDVAATALSVLDLSQLSSSSTQIARSVSSVLSLIQAVRPSIAFRSASSALGLTQLAQATISFGDVFTPSVESVLSLSQVAIVNNAISVSASNILALDHEATNDSILEHSASSTLSLAQALAHNFVLASASNVVSLTQSSGAGKNIPESAANVLALAQVLAHNFILSSASNVMALSQAASASVDQAVFISAENTFSLSQTVTQIIDHNLRIPFDQIDDQATLALTQSVLVARNLRIDVSTALALVSEVTLKEHNESIETFLSLAQKVGRKIPISASNVLFLQQEVCRIFKASSQLNLISGVVNTKGRNATSVIPFVQIATVLSEYARLLSQNLNIRQSVSLIHESSTPNIECTYSPFVGEVTSGITPPPTTIPVLGSAILTLTYPFEDPTTTIVLRNPELNNSERFQFARINRTTRGGDLKIFSDPTWPKQETLKIHIESLTSAQKDSLQSFFEDNLGLEIGLLDDENRQWKGIITQPDADFTDVRGDGCTYAVIFEFEGELQ